jgi:hypothetical protein
VDTTSRLGISSLLQVEVGSSSESTNTMRVRMLFTWSWGTSSHYLIIRLEKWLEVPQLQVKSIHTLIVLVDSLEDPTSTCKREEMPKVAVDHTPKREDTNGLAKPSEERVQALAEWDISDTFTEERRSLHKNTLQARMIN